MPDPVMFQQLVDDLRASFHTGKSRDMSWRRAQLKAIRRMLIENTEVFTAALKSDLGRPDLETSVLDLSLAVQEVDYALQNMSSWLKPKYASVPPITAPVRLLNTFAILSLKHAGDADLRLRALWGLSYHRPIQLSSAPSHLASCWSYCCGKCGTDQAK